MLIYFLRRMNFVLVAFYMEEPQIFQIIYILLTNQLMLMYHGFVRPASTRYENRFEMYNEWMVTMISINSIFYTDWISDLTLQNYLGWVTCLLVVSVVLVNIINIVFFVAKFLKLCFQKYKNRFVKLVMQKYKNLMKKRNKKDNKKQKKNNDKNLNESEMT